MKIGICVSDRNNILLAKNAGFDFVEINNGGSVINDECYPDLLSLSKDLPENFMYSCNGLIPGDVRLTGNDVDRVKIAEFCAKSFERLNSLGTKMLTFGSSGAKRVPNDFPFEKAMEQLVDALHIFSDTAKKYGQFICVEPLRYSECNIINTLDEGLELVQLANRENVGGHVDYFHYTQNGEDFAKLYTEAKRIIHAHIASPVDRRAPLRNDGADYSLFFDNLRKGGYDAAVSVEGGFDPTIDSLHESCEYLRELSQKQI